MQWRQGTYEVDTDPHRIDIERVYAYLRTTYWSSNRGFNEVRTAWENSAVVFGVYAHHVGAVQIGCARVVTDTTTFGWLADVFVDPEHRGTGVGKFLVSCVTQHPHCSHLRIFFLGTRTAHGLYAQYGWDSPRFPEWFMARYSDGPPAD